jgi:hypothetical protein
VIVVVVGAVLLTRLTGSGNDGFSTADWAESACSSLADWRTSIMSLADVGGGMLTPESLRGKLGEADAATDRLLTELRDLGPPGLDAGTEVEQALDDAATGLQESYESLKAGAQAAADADTTAAFLQALAALGPDFQQLLDQIAETTAALQSASLFGDASAELEAAFHDAESCQQVRAES